MVMVMASPACHRIPCAVMIMSNVSSTSASRGGAACPVSIPAISRTTSCSTEVPCTRDQLARRSFSHSLLLLVSSLIFQGFTQEDALAFSFGISGPKEWLKGQKKNSANFLLAPILASRERLAEAVSMTEANSVDKALRLVQVAARDCIKPDEGSILAFQTKTGVEVCTFRLILKNAASLLDDNDPVKINASIALDNLISSFTNLNSSLSGSSAESRDGIPDAFYQTNSALDKFESGIRECLGIS